ncbi:hypothetical protein [Mongoliitalea daihaiensis]|uniref:hypothetical protein n=1 Tax=Mongoliitalea daihaiensis TaxID=2782006 RepID=UPI001F453565|nr:hypothetical protein [Mongoliitalea daihaiensis]UJP66327.1 hypothetical protein IPZ59_06840 [Mongoliitalea daihaiensis]
MLLLILASSEHLCAQDIGRIPRWEIGLDALSLIDKNELPAYSIFGRMVLNPQTTKKTSLRLRLGVEGYTNLDSAFSGNRVGLDYRTNSFYISTGIQKELLNLGNCSVYVGGDFGFYRKANLKDHTGEFGWNVIGYDNYREINLRFAGILGYTHQLGNNFAISVESSLQTNYSNQKQDTDYVSAFSEDVLIVTVENRTITIWRSGFTPFYQVLFSYRF